MEVKETVVKTIDIHGRPILSRQQILAEALVELEEDQDEIDEMEEMEEWDELEDFDFDEDNDWSDWWGV